jgi:hypothetical protein
MGLDMFFQILRTLEGFPAKVAPMRLQWDMNADMGRDMITLYCSGATATPLAGQV